MRGSWSRHLGRGDWQRSEAWAFALRDRRAQHVTGDDTDLDMSQWQGEQRAAVLLAVLHAVATLSGLSPDAWRLRRWLTSGGDAGVEGLVGRLHAQVGAALSRAGAASPVVPRLRDAWAYLTSAEHGSASAMRLALMSACAHAQWLLDAELVEELDGIPPFSTVRILTGPAAGRLGVIDIAYWLDDSGPPVGYAVWVADGQIRLDQRADAVVLVTTSDLERSAAGAAAYRPGHPPLPGAASGKRRARTDRAGTDRAGTDRAGTGAAGRIMARILHLLEPLVWLSPLPFPPIGLVSAAEQPADASDPDPGRARGEADAA
jgi:hypothetical protein